MELHWSVLLFVIGVSMDRKEGTRKTHVRAVEKLSSLVVLMAQMMLGLEAIMSIRLGTPTRLAPSPYVI